MAWRLIDKPKTLQATRRLALQFVEMDAAPHDRPLSERRLSVYHRIMAEGGFRPVTWASAKCKATGGMYRVNGKHTSTMLSTLDVLPQFFVVVEEYECDTLDDVARLYATFDSNIQSRSAGDVYMSFAATVDELRDLPRKYISVAVSGMYYHLMDGGSTGNHGRSQPADRAELLLEHPDFVVWMANMFRNQMDGVETMEDRKRSQHLRRSPVVAAMLGTWLKAPADAEKFWAAVRDETGEKPDLPDRKLARFLITSGLDVAAKHFGRSVSQKEMYIKAIHAWNAWRKGETTNLRFYADADAPAIK